MTGLDIEFIEKRIQKLDFKQVKNYGAGRDYLLKEMLGED